MRVVLSFVLASFVLLFTHGGPGRAALDTAPARAHSMELLIFEHADCVYCRVFRRDIQTRYERTGSAAEVPLRFIDIEKADTTRLGLNSPLVLLPTAVLMKDGREVDRVSGYWGPDNFFKMLAHIMMKAE